MRKPFYISSNCPKHYYAGTQRVSSKIGTTENVGDYLYDWFTGGMGGPVDVIGSSFGVLENAEQGVVQVYDEFGIEPPVYESNPVFIPVQSFVHGGNEVEQYFFHPDHLGSTSYITNFLGEVSQHMEYFAFGETFVEEHRSSNNSPYKFNGKELDEETGWYYYGARYYDPRISVWLSVDPLAEKAPNYSSYIYAFNNPIVFIDPDGRWPWPTKNDPWVKGAGIFRNVFKNSARIHAENYAKNVNGNVVEGAGWGFHVIYSNYEDGIHWQSKANFKKGSNNPNPDSINSYGDLGYSIAGDALIMGNILDIPIDLATMGIVQGSEALGMSEDNSMILAGVLIFVNDVKGIKVNKIINNADDLIQAAGGFKGRKTLTAENTVSGSRNDVFDIITKDGVQTKGGAIEKDGMIFNKHNSKTKGPTITIDQPGQLQRKVIFDKE